MQTIDSTSIAITITMITIPAITITAMTIIDVNERESINHPIDLRKISALNRAIQTSMYPRKRKMIAGKEGVAFSLDKGITSRRTVRSDGGRLPLQQTRESMMLISENPT